MATSASNRSEQLLALSKRNRALANALSSDEPYSGVERLATQKYFSFNNDGQYLVVSDEEMRFLCSIGTIRSIKDMVYRLELTEQAKASLKLLLEFGPIEEEPIPIVFAEPTVIFTDEVRARSYYF